MCVCVCVCNRIQIQLKCRNECRFFPSVCRLTVNCEEPDCSLVNCHIVCFFVWHCASASAMQSKHKQYEGSEVKVGMNINIIHCWRIRPSGMLCCVTGLVVWMFLKNHSTLFLTVQHSREGLAKHFEGACPNCV